MTDAQIIEALGWAAPPNDAPLGGLFSKVRSVVAAAQAEQFERIERMRAALAAAREIFAIDRDAFAECCRSPVEPHYDDNDAAYLAGMDAVLRQIDEAMGESNESR